MTRWRRGPAAAALFVSGGLALIGGTTVAVLQAIQLLFGVGGWALWIVVSNLRFFNAPKPEPTPFPSVDFLTPGLLFVVGVFFVLMGWVALIRASTLVWPDRFDRSGQGGLGADLAGLLNTSQPA
ncbi:MULTISPECIES: hypothetical protein [Bacteria]